MWLSFYIYIYIFFLWENTYAICQLFNGHNLVLKFQVIIFNSRVQVGLLVNTFNTSNTIPLRLRDNWDWPLLAGA